MDSNRNLRIVRTSGPSYPYPYKDNVLWVYHDEDNNPVIKIWDHGKWVPFTGVGSGSGDITIDTELKDGSANPVQNKAIKKAIDAKQDKGDYALKSEIPDITGFATKDDITRVEDKAAANEVDILKKVDKVAGKGLSTNDFTDDDKNKLDGIEKGANNTVVDSFLSDESENPVQNKVVTNSISSISNRVASSDSLGMIKSSLVSDDGRLEVPYIHAVRKSDHNNFYSVINKVLASISGKYSSDQDNYQIIDKSSYTLYESGKITYDEVYNALYSNSLKSLCKLFVLIDDDSSNGSDLEINTTNIFAVTSLESNSLYFVINYLEHKPYSNIRPSNCCVVLNLNLNDISFKCYPHFTLNRYTNTIPETLEYPNNYVPTLYAVSTALRNKVTVVDGKQLSTNDYTNEDKAKVDAAITEHQKLKTINGESLEGEGNIEIHGGSSVAVDSDLSDSSENPVQNKVITAALVELQDYCFPISLEATVSPSSVEWTGSSVEVTVWYKIIRNSKAVVADTININFNGETKSIENESSGSEKFIITSQGYKSGSVSAKKGTTTIKNSPRSISVNLYLPVYYGFSKATGNDVVITDLTKGGSSISGTKILNNDDATKYLWLCVPSSMSISKVTSSGFDVPFLAPVEASTTLGSYKCYRTQDLPGSGEMTIVIS